LKKGGEGGFSPDHAPRKSVVRVAEEEIIGTTPAAKLFALQGEATLPTDDLMADRTFAEYAFVARDPAATAVLFEKSHIGGL
jgi:hypothetical protein